MRSHSWPTTATRTRCASRPPRLWSGSPKRATSLPPCWSSSKNSPRHRIGSNHHRTGDAMSSEAQERGRTTWGAGDFDAGGQKILAVGTDLVGRVGVGEGDKVLDVACGTGNATIPAAQAGGDATGL